MGAMTKKQFNDGLKAILDGGRDIERAADETHYIHTPSGTKLERTTTWLSDGKPFFLPAQWMGCLPIGSAVDQVIRDYFVDGPESLKYETYSEHISHGAYEQLMEDLVPYAAQLAEDGWEVHATDECYFEEEILVDISDPLEMKAGFKQKQIEATWEKLFK